jgi:hypothetical protein
MNLDRKFKRMSDEDILAIAGRKEFEVRRYLWSHEHLRKKCRRLWKEGKLVLLRDTGTSFVYVAATAIDCKNRVK